jgi:hypothetical protein
VRHSGRRFYVTGAAPPALFVRVLLSSTDFHGTPSCVPPAVLPVSFQCLPACFRPFLCPCAPHPSRHWLGLARLLQWSPPSDPASACACVSLMCVRARVSIRSCACIYVVVWLFCFDGALNECTYMHVNVGVLVHTQACMHIRAQASKTQAPARNHNFLIIKLTHNTHCCIVLTRRIHTHVMREVGTTYVRSISPRTCFTRVQQTYMYMHTAHIISYI